MLVVCVYIIQIKLVYWSCLYMLIFFFLTSIIDWYLVVYFIVCLYKYIEHILFVKEIFIKIFERELQV